MEHIAKNHLLIAEDAIQPRSMAWVLNDKRKIVELDVERINASFIRKQNVYGNELPYTEKVTYFFTDGTVRDISEVFHSKDELLKSL